MCEFCKIFIRREEVERKLPFLDRVIKQLLSTRGQYDKFRYVNEGRLPRREIESLDNYKEDEKG